jgi:hypothetical protein
MTPKRACGDCQLCCKLLPIPVLEKKAGTKCRFQRHHKGCTVHGTVKQPRECKLWFCRWLLNDDAAALSRPDRAHYVIDMMPDELAVTDDETGERQTFNAIQVWVDPDYPDAWRDDDAFFDWVKRKGLAGHPVMIRNGTRNAMGVFTPNLSPTGEWFIQGGTINETMGLWK